MGGCFSKKKSSNNNVVTPTDPQFDLPQNVTKKEVFVIKHRISHEINQHSDQGGIPEASTSRLTRSKSTGANPTTTRRRRHSRFKRSFDFDLNTRINNANEDFDAFHHHHPKEFRTTTSRSRSSSSSTSSSRRRKEERRSSSKERRISISPSRRSLSPSPSLCNLNTTVPSTNRLPPKMVSVPATRKTNNAASGGAVKRIHVKRNVSPASRTNLCVYTETRSQEQESNNTRVPDQRRKSLVEIDNNATPSNTKMTRKLSWDLDIIYDPSPPTYASLLLEDIRNFHQKNTSHPATSPPAFAVPECVNKAYSIMEAVADLNSNTRWRNPTSLNSLSSAIQVQECQSPRLQN